MTPEEYLDALLSLPQVLSPLVSKDGRWVAWTWYRAAPTMEVFVAPADGSAPPIRLTDTPENTFCIGWTPDNTAVIVSQDHHGDEHAQLFRINLDAPLTMIPLTEPNPNYFIRGGALHPDGNTLVYAANVDESGQTIEQSWVYRHDLRAGKRTPLARPEKGNYVFPLLSPTGTHILYNRKDRHPAGDQMWLVDIDGKDDREVLNFGDQVKTFASWFPDGQRVLVISETPTHMRLGVWRIADPPNAVRWLIDDEKRTIENAYVPFNSHSIVVIETSDARTRASLLDPNTGSEMSISVDTMTLLPIAPVQNGGWVGQIYSAKQPGELVRFDPRQPNPDTFTSITRVWDRTRITPADLTLPQDYRWTSVDGMAIQGWLYRPAGEARGTIVYVHGGPTYHSENEINAELQYFVRQGYNVLDPNYRGSTGFGRPFRESIKEDGWGGREQDDIRAGIEALIRDGIAQRGKVGVTGTSYGGYSSWHAITHLPADILAASAPICGMTDLVIDYETTRPDLRPYSEEMLGGTPTTAPERFRERSPINFVQNIRGRLMIIQGLQDPNVTPQNVETVVKALHEHGIEYELLAFDDEGHGISKPRNQKRLYMALDTFFGAAFADAKEATA